MVMKKNWKNRSGVSPVIATILMVAITVVLAAVLYVMVMGFGGTSSSAPTGTFTSAAKSSTANTMVFTFNTMSKDTQFTDCKVSIVKDSGASSLTPALATGSTGVTTTDTTYKVVSTDLGGDGKISNGDYLTISATTLTSGSTYTVTLLYNDGSQICQKSLTY